MTMRLINFTILIPLLASCCKEPDDNCKPPEKIVEIKITDLLPDYLNSFEQLELRSVSIRFYSPDGTTVINKKITGNDGSFSMPYGKYSVLIFSSDFYELDGVLYRGEKTIQTYEAYSRQYTEGGNLFVNEPDPLFYAYVEKFVIDQSFELLPVKLTPLVFTYRFKIWVEGINLLTGASATVGGMYTSAFLKDGSHRIAEVASMRVPVTKVVTKATEGYLQGEFRSFGSHQSSDIKHKITLILSNGTTKVVELDDLTNEIKSLPRGGEIPIKQKIVIKADSGNGNNEYNPGVNPWDDIEIILPI